VFCSCRLSKSWISSIGILFNWRARATTQSQQYLAAERTEAPTVTGVHPSFFKQIVHEDRTDTVLLLIIYFLSFIMFLPPLKGPELLKEAKLVLTCSSPLPLPLSPCQPYPTPGNDFPLYVEKEARQLVKLSTGKALHLVFIQYVSIATKPRPPLLQFSRTPTYLPILSRLDP
jgi:hypothetical protein